MNLQLAFHFLNRPPRHIHRQPSNVIRYQILNRPCHCAGSSPWTLFFPRTRCKSLNTFYSRILKHLFQTPPKSSCSTSYPYFFSFTSFTSFTSSTSLTSHRSLQLLDLRSPQRPEFPRLHIQFQRPQLHPPNFLHKMSHLLKHPPNLPVPSLDQNHFIPRIRPILRQPYLRWRSFHPPPILQLNRNSRPQTLDAFLFRLSAHLHQIRFRHMRTGLHQLLRQRSVIGHQHQSLAPIIQPPHGIHSPRAIPQKIHHRRPPFRIAYRRHIPFWLVQQKINRLLPFPNGLPIHANNIPLRISLRPLFPHHFAIQRHSPSRNHLFRFAPRRNPASRHYFL